MPCSELDLDYLRKLVHTESSNVVDHTYDNLFETRLTPLVRQMGLATLAEMVAKLRNQMPGPVHRQVAELMTINETSFFRDISSFDALRDEILPRVIEQRRGQRSLRIWSAASSTGQEAYSIAMLMQENFPDILKNWDIRIVGTDYSAAMVKYAQAGRFKRIEVNRGLPARLMIKYFVRQEEEWEISQDLRHICEFRQVNLCTPLPAMPPFDLVLLRNVLIYFSPQDRAKLLNNVRNMMVPHSVLLLGNAEQVDGAGHLFESAFSGRMYYYRPVRLAA